MERVKSFDVSAGTTKEIDGRINTWLDRHQGIRELTWVVVRVGVLSVFYKDMKEKTEWEVQSKGSEK